MRTWTPLPEGVAWRREPLFDLVLRRSAIVGRFGEPQHLDLDSNGVGDFDEEASEADLCALLGVEASDDADADEIVQAYFER